MFFFPVTAKARARRKAASDIYTKAVDRGREPVFYSSLSVPDTINGRFEMIALHTGMIINRIRSEGEDGKKLAQAVFDEMFLNMELSCRQLGIGDLGVPKHIKRMMKAMQGRAVIYDQAISEGKQAVESALTKNLYGTVGRPNREVLERMADYLISNHEMLKTYDLKTIQHALFEFAPMPEITGDLNVPSSKVA